MNTTCMTSAFEIKMSIEYRANVEGLFIFGVYFHFQQDVFLCICADDFSVAHALRLPALVEKGSEADVMNGCPLLGKPLNYMYVLLAFSFATAAK